jgi:TolB-like protein/Tfp pilus assembly protein PilF
LVDSVTVSMRWLYKEVRRRRMPQALAAYLLAVITILTAADLVLPGLPVPEATYKMLVVVLVCMIPVVITISWFFDITTSGIVRTLAGEDEPSNAEPLQDSASDQLDRRSSIESVAVLPFVNSSSDDEGEYLSDGITETIINKLANVSDVRVIPRASAFRYKNSTMLPQEVCEQLNVQTSVTGSVHHFGDQLIVQAELVNPREESQIWGERYNAQWRNLFEVQEEIATKISESLKPELSRDERRRLKQRETENLEAYQDYLRGRFHWNKRTAEDVTEAIAHFRKALEKDPLYAIAYTGLGDAYNILGYYGVVSPDESFPLAQEADQEALRLQPDLAEAHASLGYCILFYHRDWELARFHFQRAIELNPRYGNAHQWYAWYLMVMERFDEALESFKRALKLDPLSQIINDHLAYGFMLTGQREEARKQIERTRSLDPSYSLVLWRLGDWHMADGNYAEAAQVYDEVQKKRDGRFTLGHLGLSYGLMGEREKAEAVLAKMDIYEQKRYVSRLDRALVYAGLDRRDDAFAALEEARTERVSDMVRFKLLPWPDSFRGDSRFADMIKALDLPA